jgi:ATP-dependent Clp protease ATP-binding subunit ClpA
MGEAASSQVTRVAVATSSQDPEVGLAAASPSRRCTTSTPVDDSASGGSGVVQRSEHARRVLDLAGDEAERLGHRYLGPEHLVLGVLRDGDSGASRVLEAYGVDLAAAQATLRRLAARGVVPRPRPSDAELLGSLGIDLAEVAELRAGVP